MTKWLATDFEFNERSIVNERTLREELVNYCNSRFPGLLKTLTQEEEDEFLRDIVLVLLARKRNRNFDYLPPKEDSCWDIVINTNTSLSTHRVEAYLEKRGLAFLCMWFCLFEGKESIRAEFAGKR